MVLSSLKPTVEPGATSTVVLPGPVLMLQRISLEVTEVTGELLTGWRTAAVEVVPSAIKVVQMSENSSSQNHEVGEGGRLTMGRCCLRNGDQGSKAEKLHFDQRTESSYEE